MVGPVVIHECIILRLTFSPLLQCVVIHTQLISARIQALHLFSKDPYDLRIH